MLSSEMLLALQRQLTLERTNAAIYDALSASLDAVNWPGSAHYMHESGNEERTHAKKFKNYIISRNETPFYDALPLCPMLEDDDLSMYFQAAMDRERMTTAAINALYEQADEGNDPQTCQFLQYFLWEQTKSERDLTDILLELNRSDNNGRLVLDKKYKKAK